MTKSDSIALKERVRTALKQQKRQNDLETQLTDTSVSLRKTLEEIEVVILLERDPIVVRFGSRLFHVTQSPTSNPIAPVEIREAKLVA